MPLASLFAQQFYGPGCTTAFGQATNTSPLAGLVGDGRLGGTNTISVTAYARISDGRRIAAVNTATNTSPLAAIKGDGRIGAVGKVNELSQDDVTGAVLEAKVDGEYTLKQVLKILAATAAGKTSNDGKTFRNLSDDKDVVVGTVTGNNRTAATYDVS
jgi:hypothetical protein